MKVLSIWLLVVLVITGGALMACKSKKKTSTATPTATKSSSATQPSGTTPSSQTPSSSGNAPNLSDLVSKVGTKTVKASYTFSGTGATGAESFTLYSKPPDSRVDVTSGGTTSIFITRGGTDYICDESGQTCSVSPVPLASTLPFLAFIINPQTLSGIVSSYLEHSTKTVAGQDADCYSATAAGATSQVCFNHDGILVSLHASAGGSDITLEATSVEGTVADSDLQPPYPVQ